MFFIDLDGSDNETNSSKLQRLNSRITGSGGQISNEHSFEQLTLDDTNQQEQQTLVNKRRNKFEKNCFSLVESFINAIISSFI